ncbi:putative regulator of Ras-like GTPase activity (Roadblock/LC7/MglB family) [Deinobacterium chartae]|uniref:Putative regulator of Ras-like GTPase activity (Roadblock/LC7/MglB family) n=1 Tax=Deinobacterium chartae TaxID=521158 RepID=A0A841I179_9DEIO|nr:roadblock/LC7 domain-containing protein [Deinobacterium chartae]MBB6098744.1 putative regulator of Ras-like GTPase activity (Roadblock/LC7/MglB family) [Deinobacterium chartae]
MIEPSLALYGEAFERVGHLLDELLQTTHARYTLLVDRKGFVLAHKEALWAPRPPSLDSIATLIAGNAAATSALAKLLGESQFNELVHQGENVGLYVEGVSTYALMVVIFDGSAPLGRIKLFVKKTIGEVAHILEQEANAPKPDLKLDGDFSSSASALLDDLFG